MNDTSLATQHTYQILSVYRFIIVIAVLHLLDRLDNDTPILLCNGGSAENANILRHVVSVKHIRWMARNSRKEDSES